ncbi:MAG: hypothetical protein JNK05_23645 [Myxococcales bacterium]|nr:hypothetical protein [Myxococcales bacterium]
MIAIALLGACRGHDPNRWPLAASPEQEARGVRYRRTSLLVVRDAWACAARRDATWCWSRFHDSVRDRTEPDRDEDARAAPPVRVAGRALHLAAPSHQGVCAYDPRGDAYCGGPSEPWVYRSERLAPVWWPQLYVSSDRTADEHALGVGDGYHCARAAHGAVLCDGFTHGPMGLRSPSDEPDSQFERWRLAAPSVASVPDVREVAISQRLVCVRSGAAGSVRCFGDRGAFAPDFRAVSLSASRQQLCALTEDARVLCAPSLAPGGADAAECGARVAEHEIPGGPYREVHSSLPCAITSESPARVRCWGSVGATVDPPRPTWPPRVIALDSAAVGFARRALWVRTERGAWVNIEPQHAMDLAPTAEEQTGRSARSAFAHCRVVERTVSCLIGPPSGPAPRWADVFARDPIEQPIESIELGGSTLCVVTTDRTSVCINLAARARLEVAQPVRVLDDGRVCRFGEQDALECTPAGALDDAADTRWSRIAPPGMLLVRAAADRACWIDRSQRVYCQSIVAGAAIEPMFSTVPGRIASLMVGADATCALFDDGRLVCAGRSALCNAGARTVPDAPVWREVRFGRE